MDRRTRIAAIVSAIVVGTAGGGRAQESQREVIFSEDFADVALPAWRGARPAAVKIRPIQGPGDIRGVTMETPTPASSSLSVSLPVERIAGKGVLLEVWRKAENVKTGAHHYCNAESMLNWKAKGGARPNYSSTTYSDFSGTFNWEKHSYVMEMPKDLEWANVTIGLQACSGKAGWAGLTVSVDPRFPNQQALERFLAREERRAFAELDPETLTVKCLDGGIIQVLAGHRYVPRKFWNAAVREKVLSSIQHPGEESPPSAPMSSISTTFPVNPSRCRPIPSGIDRAEVELVPESRAMFRQTPGTCL